MDWINFKKLKTLPYALSLELCDKRVVYWKFWLSKNFIQPTCRPSYNNTTRNVYPLNYFLLSLLWTLWHTVNMAFLFSFLRTYIMKQSTSFYFKTDNNTSILQQLQFLEY